MRHFTHFFSHGILATLAMASFLFAGNVSAQCNIPNAGFESWTTDTIQDLSGNDHYIQLPEDWISLTAIFSTIFGDSVWLAPSTDAHSGSSALSMGVDSAGSGTDVLTLSPCDQRPGALKGFYKYDGDASVDSSDATIVVAFTKWNAAADSSDIIGQGVFIFQPNTSYTEFQAPIQYLNMDQPDTMIILVQYFEGRPLTTLLVDDLAFGEATSLDNLLASDEVSVTPNPAEDFLRIELASERFVPGAEVRLFDIQGRRVLGQKLEGPVSSIPVGQLPSGAYIFRLDSGNKFFQQKVIKR